MAVHHFDYQNRPDIRWYHHVADFANLLKAFVGTNYLSLAYGFQQAGIGLGAIGLVFVAILTDHCCQLLIRVKYLVVEQFCDQHMFPDGRKTSSTSSATSVHDDTVQEFSALLRDRMLKNLTYPDLGRILFGQTGATMVNAFLLITQFGFCMNYYIFVGNILYSFLPLKNATIAPNDFNNSIMATGIVTDTAHLMSLEKRDTINSIAPVPSILLNSTAIDEALVTLYSSVNNTGTNSTSSTILATTDVPITAAFDSIVTTIQDTTQSLLSDIAQVVTPTDSSVSGENFEAIPKSKQERVGPSLALMVLVPTPLLIIFTLFRDVRRMGPISAVANLSVICGSLAVLIYIMTDFSVAPDVVWFKFATVSVFLGQVTASYEGIGTIMSIEGSMDGNRHCFSGCLHGAIITFTITLFMMAVVGYLRFGEATEQILVQNLPLGDAVTIMVNITLLIGVLCTYPLQVFPVVNIIESAIFSEGGLCGPGVRDASLVSREEDDDVFCAEDANQSLLQTAEVSINEILPVAKSVPASVPNWKRNVFRILLALSIAGVSVLLRNVFAYVGAFVGAVGSCPLAFILPCLFHYKLRKSTTSPYIILKDLFIVTMGVIMAVIGCLVVTSEVIHRL